MRALLLTTTVLAGLGAITATPTFAADPLRLEIRGFYDHYFGVRLGGEGDFDDDFNETNLVTNGEIHFRGETTLDNGIAVGVRVELEAETSGDQIDENYVYLEGGFGRVQFGSDDMAAYTMHTIAPQVGIGVSDAFITDFVVPTEAYLGLGNDLFFDGIPGTNVILSTGIDYTNDDNGLAYYSPRFQGFQLGLSWAPGVAANGEGFENPVDPGEEAHDALALGLNYENSFGNVDLTASGGWTSVDSLNTGRDNAYMGGVNVGFGGFTIGGSIGYQEIPEVDDADGLSWDFGASYETGPWGVSATVFRSTQEADGNDFANLDLDQDMQAYSLGAEYSMGPGIATFLNLQYIQFEADQDVADLTGADDETSAWLAIIGLNVDF